MTRRKKPKKLTAIERGLINKLKAGNRYDRFYEPTGEKALTARGIVRRNTDMILEIVRKKPKPTIFWDER